MKKRLSLGVAVALTACLVADQSAFGQGRRGSRRNYNQSGADNSQARNTPNGWNDTNSQILRTSLIVGSTVNLTDGNRYGTVQDVVLNDSGCVDYVVVQNGSSYAPVPWGLANYQFGQRILVLNIDRGRIAQIPTFTQISQLSNAQFVQKVNTYYRGAVKDRGQNGNRGRDGQNRGNDQNKSPNAAKDQNRDGKAKAADHNAPAAGAGAKNQPAAGEDKKGGNQPKPAAGNDGAKNNNKPAAANNGSENQKKPADRKP